MFALKITPTLADHFCLCICETVKYTAMHFWDNVHDSNGYLSPCKVLSDLYQKCGHVAVKPEVRFKKSAKRRMPDCKSDDYKQQTVHRQLSYFHDHLA